MSNAQTLPVEPADIVMAIMELVPDYSDMSIDLSTLAIRIVFHDPESVADINYADHHNRNEMAWRAGVEPDPVYILCDEDALMYERHVTVYTFTKWLNSKWSSKS